MRIAADTGGTFTDIVVEDDGVWSTYKTPTTPDDPVRGVLAGVELAGHDRGLSTEQMLARTDTFIHATTRAINALLTGATARTAFLTTRGHPDVLVFREGGRSEPFNFTQEYPEPYVPRALTYEVPERIGADGDVVESLDERVTVTLINQIAESDVESVAVCLLWSFINPTHERRIGELLETHLPGVPFTLSHELNPMIREYRRASSTAIDASLKPIMTTYLADLTGRLRSAGFAGRALVVTSAGGFRDAMDVAAAPIHAVGSGPAMAPVAGRYFAETDASASTAVIADAGGTSYDVSLVRRGRIPKTDETWIGRPYLGEMTGFPSVDVKSIGAGGGSIAWVDDGGLLHVGPQSAGAVPGPACYGRGGSRPTLTDASVMLGYINPDTFLGGSMPLDVGRARAAVERDVAHRLGLDRHDSAAAIVRLATENMIGAVEEITVKQGIDPATGVLVAGGGSAGLNAVGIARRLAFQRVIIPAVAPVLSAAGALMSELTNDYAISRRTVTSSFDKEAINEVLDALTARCEQFAAGPGSGSAESSVELSARGRYANQVWDLEVPLHVAQFSSEDDVDRLVQDFHATHMEVYAIDDHRSPVEFVSWHARIRCRLHWTEPTHLGAISATPPTTREVYFPESGLVEASVWRFEAMEPGASVDGPAIIDSSTTTVVINPDASVERLPTGSLSISPWANGSRGVRAGAALRAERTS